MAGQCSPAILPCDSAVSLGGFQPALARPPAKESFLGRHRTGRRLAVADAALTAPFDLKGRLAGCVVLADGNIAVLKVSGLIGAKARVGKEQDIVMHLLRIPFYGRHERARAHRRGWLHKAAYIRQG